VCDPFAVPACAQTADTSTVKTILDVSIGLARDVVLSGLAKGYKVGKVDSDGSDWLVMAKDPAHFEKAEIFFLEGKVASISTFLYPSMEGDAVKFAEHLFFLLRERATLMPGAEDALKSDPPLSLARHIANSGHLQVPVDLHSSRADAGETMEIWLNLGKSGS
jgi:hypothetical protein